MAGNLVHLGGSQNENHVGRGLLHDLEQGVEGACGEHVGLVDDIHPVFAHGRSEVGLVPQVPDVVHAVVAGGIDLHHIQHGAVVNAPADFAFPAGVSVLWDAGS